MNRKEQEWLEDFKSFIDGDEIHVPQELSKNVLSYVRNKLNPPIQQIFAKLVAIHIPIGFLSLLICDQFGMGPFQTNFSLKQYLMYFGHSTCMFLCGLFFVSTSIFVSGLFLRPEELKMLKQKSYLHSLLLSLFSINSFLMFGAEVTFTIGVLWVVGAILGGILSSYLIHYLRVKKHLFN